MTSTMTSSNEELNIPLMNGFSGYIKVSMSGKLSINISGKAYLTAAILPIGIVHRHNDSEFEFGSVGKYQITDSMEIIPLTDRLIL